MTLFFYLFFLIINLLLVISNRKSSKVAFFTFFFILVFSATRPKDVFDYINYHYEYINYDTIGGTSFGLKVFNKLGNALSLDFNTFIAFLVIIFTFIILYQVRNSRSDEHLFIVVYLTYFIFGIYQLKNFMAFVALLLSLKFLLYPNRYSTIKYYSGNAVAAAFHPSFVVYGLLPITKRNGNKYIIKFCMIIILMITLLLWVTKNSAIVSSVVKLVTPKWDNYMETSTGLSLIFILLIYLEFTLILAYYNKELKKVTTNIIILQKADRLLTINIICSVVIPLLLLNTVPYRLIRNIMLISVIEFGEGYFLLSKKKKSVVKYGTILMGICWFVFDVVIKGYFEQIVFIISS